MPKGNMETLDARSHPHMFNNNVYIYIYIHTYIITSVLGGGPTQNVSYIFQGVFEGGLENVSLHFEGILKTLPTKTKPGGSSATNFAFKGVPLKSSLKGVVIIYILYILYRYI